MRCQALCRLHPIYFPGQNSFHGGRNRLPPSECTCQVLKAWVHPAPNFSIVPWFLGSWDRFAPHLPLSAPHSFPNLQSCKRLPRLSQALSPPPSYPSYWPTQSPGGEPPCHLATGLGLPSSPLSQFWKEVRKHARVAAPVPAKSWTLHLLFCTFPPLVVWPVFTVVFRKM